MGDVNNVKCLVDNGSDNFVNGSGLNGVSLPLTKCPLCTVYWIT